MPTGKPVSHEWRAGGLLNALGLGTSEREHDNVALEPSGPLGPEEYCDDNLPS